MNLERFIATRVAFSERQSFSRLIIRIAVMAVALSLSVMIVAMAVISGFKHQIGEKIFGFWGHIHITSTQINRTTGETLPVDIRQPFYPSLVDLPPVSYTSSFSILGMDLPWEIRKSTKGAVKHIQVFALKPGIIKTKKQIEGIVLKGIGPDFDWSFFEKYLVEGKPLSLSDSMASKGIVLSQQTAKRVGLSLGDKLIFNFVKNGEVFRRAFVVEGIFKTGLEEYDLKFALVDIKRTQEMLGWSQNQVGGFEVFVDDLSDLDILTDYIYLEKLPADLYCENIREKFPAIFEWLALQDINEVVIIVLMLVVGIINMITALMILILERTNMVGILKALGQTNWSIRKIFLYYAAYIIVLGLFWGNALGLAFCWLQETYGIIKLNEANYYLPVAPIEINYLHVLLLNLGVMAVTLFFLLLPSWLVTKISPVRAIRFK